MNRPTKDGHYWFTADGENKSDSIIVAVYDFDIDYPTVAFIGSPCDKQLESMCGTFTGPLTCLGDDVDA